MAALIWYHGGSKISSFETLKLDRDRDVDQNASGPGLYWTTDRKEAARYGTNLYQASTKSWFRTMPNKPSTPVFAKKIFNAASKQSQNEFLKNFDGDSVDKALISYLRKNSMLDTAVLLYHDLFRYNADEYAKAMRTLYDGVVVAFPKTEFSGPRKHLIVWSLDKISIKEIAK